MVAEWSYLKGKQQYNMKLGEVAKKSPSGALQGPSKGSRMTKMLENGQNNESFNVVSSQMLLGIWAPNKCRKTKNGQKMMKI